MTDGPESSSPIYEPMDAQGVDAAAASSAKPAAIALIVMNAIILCSSVGSFLFMNVMRRMIEEEAKGNAQMQPLVKFYGSPMFGVLYGFSFLIAIACLFGSVRMLQMKNYGFALTAAILTMINMGSCCCVLNLGIGIWALVVLMRDDVQDAFRRAA